MVGSYYFGGAIADPSEDMVRTWCVLTVETVVLVRKQSSLLEKEAV